MRVLDVEFGTALRWVAGEQSRGRYEMLAIIVPALIRLRIRRATSSRMRALADYSWVFALHLTRMHPRFRAVTPPFLALLTTSLSLLRRLSS